MISLLELGVVLCRVQNYSMSMDSGYRGKWLEGQQLVMKLREGFGSQRRAQGTMAARRTEGRGGSKGKTGTSLPIFLSCHRPCAAFIAELSPKSSFRPLAGKLTVRRRGI